MFSSYGFSPIGRKKKEVFKLLYSGAFPLTCFGEFFGVIEMTTTKQPQPGEYWQKEDTRVFVVGRKKNGVTVGETECGGIMVFLHIHGWQHLTDCDSFLWQPEVWPQYWSAINDVMYAYCERFEPNKYRMVKRDGTVMPDSPWHPNSGRDRTRLTKEQAEALLDNPQESPDDYRSLEETKVGTVKITSVKPSPKRVPVRLWIADDDDAAWGYEIAACTEKPNRTHQPYEWRELFFDGNGEWFFEVQP